MLHTDMISIVLDVTELLGALLILLAYWAASSGRWKQSSVPYLWLNLLGSVLLGAIAVINRRPGFIILEVVWFYISLSGLLRRQSLPAREE